MNDNLQTNDREYYVPLEVTEARKKSPECNRYKMKLAWVNGKRVMAYMVPVTKEVHDEYMHFEWNESKHQQRHGDTVSLDYMWEEYGYEPCCENSRSVEEEVERNELYKAVETKISTYGNKDRTILLMHANGRSEREIARVVGMSQRGVGKRKNSLLDDLDEALKDFQEI